MRTNRGSGHLERGVCLPGGCLLTYGVPMSRQSSGRHPQADTPRSDNPLYHTLPIPHTPSIPHPLPLWTEWQTGVKTLPSLIHRMRSVKTKCPRKTTTTKNTASGGSRISPKWERQPSRGVNTRFYHISPKKLHEIERIRMSGGVCPQAPLDPPMTKKRSTSQVDEWPVVHRFKLLCQMDW